VDYKEEKGVKQGVEEGMEEGAEDVVEGVEGVEWVEGLEEFMDEEIEDDEEKVKTFEDNTRWFKETKAEEESHSHYMSPCYSFCCCIWHLEVFMIIDLSP
jgi:hypothetical protein